MESTVDDKTAMPHGSHGGTDIIIEIWHSGAHWSVKKNEDQYWYKRQADTGWKVGLPPGMTPEDAWRAFKEG